MWNRCGADHRRLLSESFPPPVGSVIVELLSPRLLRFIVAEGLSGLSRLCDLQFHGKHTARMPDGFSSHQVNIPTLEFYSGNFRQAVCLNRPTALLPNPDEQGIVKFALEMLMSLVTGGILAFSFFFFFFFKCDRPSDAEF